MTRLVSIWFTSLKIISELILSTKFGNCDVYRNDEAARRADAAITEGLNCATVMSALITVRFNHDSLEANNTKIILENKICSVVRRSYRVVIVS